MSDTTLHPGSFCWFELVTSNQTSAKKFYQTLFDWSVEDSPMGPTEVYSIFKIANDHVAAAYTLRAEQVTHHVPPHWLVYVLVADVDASATRAKQLGGAVLAPPFDVMDAGRMSVIQDPTGASFALWQARKHTGVGAAGRQGTVVWADLSTPDQAKAAAFYSGLFGWKMLAGKGQQPAKPGDYFHIVNGADFIGGVPPAAHRDPKTPPSWLIYFSVADCDHTVSTGTAMGAHVLMPPMTMEGTRRFAVLTDPQGAPFAIVQTLK